LVSYLLYANWKPAYALVLLAVTVITYFGARYLEINWNRKIIVSGGVLLALLPLIIFKYYNFFNVLVYELLTVVGLRIQLPGLNWVIPIGISFFTFQALGYLFDVYYKRISAEKDFLTYALFISFFPSIVAGPINKAEFVIPQLKALRPYFNYAKAVEGLKMLLWGMFMKVVVADRVALYVDTVFPNYMNYTGITCFVASILYTIQIYTDFAGYSLMAIGVGKTLGFELTENFKRPYFAVSVTDFWHRWHISFSTWLKDYVYIPMGGSRCSKIRNYWNIFVTFLVSGIWHGANWTFIVWGGVHGIFQIIEKALDQHRCKYGIIGRIIKILITFLLVNFAWIFFRMPTVEDSCAFIGRILDFSMPLIVYSPEKSNAVFMFLGIGLLLFKDIKDEYYSLKHLFFNSKFTLIRWLSYLSIIVLIMLAGVFGADQFIYANF
jgi:D-alanyl-lipoteichoic acid acyltransferase DltB (MBOAT superfamily)